MLMAQAHCASPTHPPLIRMDAVYADGTSSLPGACFKLETLIDNFRECRGGAAGEEADACR